MSRTKENNSETHINSIGLIIKRSKKYLSQLHIYKMEVHMYICTVYSAACVLYKQAKFKAPRGKMWNKSTAANFGPVKLLHMPLYWLVSSVFSQCVSVSECVLSFVCCLFADCQQFRNKEKSKKRAIEAHGVITAYRWGLDRLQSSERHASFFPAIFCQKLMAIIIIRGA